MYDIIFRIYISETKKNYRYHQVINEYIKEEILKEKRIGKGILVILKIRSLNSKSSFLQTLFYTTVNC